MAKKPREKVTTIQQERPRVEPRPYVPLDEVLGQDRAISALLSPIASGRLHHAWVFHGPVGVGKFTTAMAFAGLLLDPGASRDLSGRLSVDPASQTQHLIRAGLHPDLHIIMKEMAAISREANIRSSKQTTIAKDVIDEFLIEPAARTRAITGGSAAGKVFIIDEAELIDARVQNSLLKLMEEPPPGTVIILVTASEERVLPTLRSRSQRVLFHTLPPTDMEKWLQRRDVEIEPAHRAWILDFAAGSPGLAAAAIDNDLYEWHRVLGPMLEEVGAGRFSLEMGAALHQLVEERASAVVKKHPDASKDGANKVWARRLFAFLAEETRRRMRQAADRGGDEQGLGRSLKVLDAISGAEQQLGANVNMAMVMENLAAQVVA